MRRVWLLLLVLVSAGPVAARCVGPGDAARGVDFAREDGRHGRLIQAGSVVKINYDLRSEFWVDRRMVEGGVFETLTDWWPVDGESVGDGVTEWAYRYAEPLPQAISPGMTYTSAVEARMTSFAPVAGGPIKRRFAQEVRYAALEAMDVKIGGCPYRVIPVEATWSGEEAEGRFQRWLYFADLGFAIETRAHGARLGLTGLSPAP